MDLLLTFVKEKFQYSLNPPADDPSVKKIMWRYVTLDFEIAVRSTFYALDPTFIVLGCWFHYVQAVLRSAFSYHTLRQAFFVPGTGFRRFLREIFSLAFIPEAHVRNVFDEVVLKYKAKMAHEFLRNPQFRAEFVAFADVYMLWWFRPSFIKQWRIPPGIWHWTCCKVEAFHLTIQRFLDTHHGSFFNCVLGIQDIYKDQSTKFDKLMRGEIPLPYSGRNRPPIHQRVQNLMLRFELGDEVSLTPFNLLTLIANIFEGIPINPFGGNSAFAEDVEGLFFPDGVAITPDNRNHIPEGNIAISGVDQLDVPNRPVQRRVFDFTVSDSLARRNIVSIRSRHIRP